MTPTTRINVYKKYKPWGNIISKSYKISDFNKEQNNKKVENEPSQKEQKIQLALRLASIQQLHGAISFSQSGWLQNGCWSVVPGMMRVHFQIRVIVDGVALMVQGSLVHMFLGSMFGSTQRSFYGGSKMFVAMGLLYERIREICG